MAMTTDSSQQPVSIGAPVRGSWAIMNPPGHPKRAVDLLAVDDNNSPYDGVSLARHIFRTICVDDTYAWGKPVVAVMDGTIVEAIDGVADRERICMSRDLLRLMLFRPKPAPPFSALGGNYVIMKCGDVYPLYAHLQRGSVSVRAGQAVRRGDVLGSVGNSGASLQPHLHFQIMATPDPFPLFSNLLPFVFASAQRRIGQRWHSADRQPLRNGDHLRL